MTTAILLAVAALAFLVLEVFLVSFGMLSLVAVGCGVASAVVAFGVGNGFGWAMLGTLVVAGPACVVGAFRLLPHVPFARRMYLDAPEQTDSTDARSGLLGSIGRTVTPLRPSGTALFDGEPVDVLSDGTLIESDEPVRVVEVSGNRVRVVHHSQQSQS